MCIGRSDKRVQPLATPARFALLAAGVENAYIADNENEEVEERNRAEQGGGHGETQDRPSEGRFPIERPEAGIRRCGGGGIAPHRKASDSKEASDEE